MVITSVEAKEMLNHPDVQGIIDALLPDGITREQMEACIMDSNVYSIGHIGFFTSEQAQEDGRLECHAYFFPSQRRNSIRGLKAIVDYAKEQGYGVYTTVTGNFPHVLRVLSMIGFKVDSVTEEALTKQGITYPAYHLTNEMP